MDISLWKDHLLNANPVYQSLIDHDLDAVRRYFHCGGSVYLEDDNLPSLFALAWDKDDFSRMELFFEHGFDVNRVRNRFGETCLIMSCGHPKLFEYFLSKGANIHKLDGYGMSCLHRAAGGGEVEIIQKCLRAGLNLNDRCGTGWSPLRCASSEQHLEAMSLLLKHGADIEAPLDNGRTILIGAAQGGKTESIVFLLHNGANIHAKDDRGKTAMDWALANGRLEAVEILKRYLEQGGAATRHE